MKVLVLRNDNWHSADFDAGARRVKVHDLTDRGGGSAEPYLVPGLVDCHCHGVDGMDVMDGDAEQIGNNLRERGIEFYCPTTITAPWEEIRSALAPCRNWFPGFAGVHLEGPFINPDRCGAQPKNYIVAPNFSEMQRELSELLSIVKIVTLAPEIPGAVSLIHELRERGVIVSAGHTDAKCDELTNSRIERMTHFYNAMRPFHHRDPGAVGYGLMNDVTLEVIYDRVHVFREAMEIVLKTRPGGESVLAVSDGTRLSGRSDGAEIEMWGRVVRKVDGAARSSDGTLSGSAVTLADVFRNIWQDFSPYLAVKACSENPRRHLGLPPPKLWLLVDTAGNIIQVFEMDLGLA